MFYEVDRSTCRIYSGISTAGNEGIEKYTHPVSERDNGLVYQIQPYRISTTANPINAIPKIPLTALPLSSMASKHHRTGGKRTNPHALLELSQLCGIHDDGCCG